MTEDAAAGPLAQELAREVKRTSGWYMFLGVMMILVGTFAIARPMAAGLALTAVVGWVLIFAGVFRMVHCFMARTGGGFLFRLAMAVLYLLGGYLILSNLYQGMAALTVVLAGVIFLAGVLRLMVARAMRGVPGVGWLIFGGIVSIVLAIMIWTRLPASSEFMIGLLVGLHFIMSGFTTLTLALQARSMGDALTA